MKNSTLPYWLTLMVVLGAAYGGWHVWKTEQARHAQRPSIMEPTEEAEAAVLADFTLVERSGKPFYSRDMHGKVWVASFFFTSCPNVCLTMNQTLAVMQEADGLEDVHFVSITCDPDTDTPDVLTKYADRFKADPERWLFCTGEFDYIQRVGQDIMKLTVLEQVHKEHAVIIDRAGKIRSYFRVTNTGELAVARKLLLECLAEAPPQVDASASTADASFARQPGASAP